MKNILKNVVQNFLFCTIMVACALNMTACSGKASYLLQSADGISDLSALMETDSWVEGVSAESISADNQAVSGLSQELAGDQGYGAEAAEANDSDQDGSAGAQIYIYICGAVNAPGVYQLPENSRVFEAINAAGGLREDADSRNLNQAEWLSDGMQITVYTKEEVESGQAGNGISLSGNSSGNTGQQNVGSTGSAGSTGTDKGAASDGKVNINTATVEELMTLSGIGESRAGDIIAYRNSHGGFSDIQEITNVSGIGDKSFEKIKDQITV